MAHFTHHSEENYLKTLYKLESSAAKKVNNIALSKALELNPATVLEMVRKLTERKLVEVKADKSIHLTTTGKKRALQTIRKHRLWEVFLVDKLGYKWNEVHELAEQLEHIESEDLVDRLDAFLDNPALDPHGDPIPDRQGKIKSTETIPLSECKLSKTLVVVRLADTSDTFLEYLEKLGIKPGSKVKITDRQEYDQSCTVEINKKVVHLSEKAAQNIMVQ